jgi:hypothetical protein
MVAHHLEVTRMPTEVESKSIVYLSMVDLSLVSSSSILEGPLRLLLTVDLLLTMAPLLPGLLSSKDLNKVQDSIRPNLVKSFTINNNNHLSITLLRCSIIDLCLIPGVHQPAGSRVTVNDYLLVLVNHSLPILMLICKDKLRTHLRIDLLRLCPTLHHNNSNNTNSMVFLLLGHHRKLITNNTKDNRNNVHLLRGNRDSSTRLSRDIFLLRPRA